MELPHRARWSLDEYAEASTVLADSDEAFTAELELLEPVGWRVGLLALAGGLDSRVVDPPALVVQGPELARRLLEHHRA
jgi:hypothetical protein